MPDNKTLINFNDLQDITGYSRPADVERCLKTQGVPIFFGKKGPWTTLRALHVAQGLDYQAEEQIEKMEF